MDHFTSDIIQALVKKEDVTEIFRSHLETAVNTLLKTELTACVNGSIKMALTLTWGTSMYGLRLVHEIF